MIDLLTASADEVISYATQAVSDSFIAETAARSRPPHHLGLSSLGGCTRAAAYALARTPISDTPPVEEGREANLGTWEHAGLLPRLAEQTRGEYEVPVILRAAGVEVPGTADLLVPHAVWDLKTVAAHKLQTVRHRVSPYRTHRVQVLGYVLAVVQSGRPVRWAIWLYMDRATGEVEIVIEEFTTRAAMEVIDRVAEIRRYAETDPDAAPSEERGPGLSRTCDGCPWLRRCWGPDAVPGEVGGQRYRLAGATYDDPRAEEYLARYKDASVREGEAKRDKEFYAAVISGLPHGVYGPWKLSRDKDGVTMDQSRVTREYSEGRHSPELPMMRKRGSLRVKLIRANGDTTTRKVTTG